MSLQNDHFSLNLRWLLVNLLLITFSISSALAQSNGEVRLVVDGLSNGRYTSGRVQVYYSGQWGNICDNGFGATEANVICHQLGYDGATGFATAARDSFGIDDHPPLLRDLSCSNNNSLHILQCNYNDTEVYCDNSNEVSVVCSLTPIWTDPYSNAVRLVAGGYPSYGRLEIYAVSDGFSSRQWRTLCDNGFGKSESNTACRQLGYTYALNYNHLHNIDGTGARVAQYTCCSRSTDCLESCYCQESDDDTTTTTTSSSFKTTRRQKRIDLICNHDDDVTLQCDFDVSQKSDAGYKGECDFTIRNTIVGIVVGSVFGGIFFIICCIIGWVAGVCFCCNK